jgi:oxygen-independent coproporphyrinogen-3 oxidase
MAGYLEVVGNGDLPLGRAYRLDAEAQLVRELILQLKLGGADFASLERRHGMAPEQQFAHTLDQFTASGWLRVHDRHATLTREGLVRIDHLLPAFYPPRYRSVRYS